MASEKVAKDRSGHVCLVQATAGTELWRAAELWYLIQYSDHTTALDFLQEQTFFSSQRPHRQHLSVSKFRSSRHGPCFIYTC
jgi:hypothetical protein